MKATNNTNAAAGITPAATVAEAPVQSGTAVGEKSARVRDAWERKAILVRFIPASNTKGSRLVATAEGGLRVTISNPHDCNPREAKARAALALARKFGWTGELVAGGTPDGATVFVFVD